MKAYTWILFEELVDRPCLVSREVVEDDVNLLAREARRNDFAEKSDEVMAELRMLLDQVRSGSLDASAFLRELPGRTRMRLKKTLELTQVELLFSRRTPVSLPVEKQRYLTV